MGNWHQELKAAFDAAKKLDSDYCSEKELTDTVNRFRIAATDYAYHVVRFAPSINSKRMALRARGKDDDYIFSVGLSKFLWEGLDLPKEKAKNDKQEQEQVTPEKLNKATLNRATFERIRSIKEPASYIYRAIDNALSDQLREKKRKTIFISINTVIGDGSNGTDLEENGRIDGRVVATTSAEDDFLEKNNRSETDKMLTVFLRELAEKNALGFVAFSTCMVPNCHGEITGRCNSQELSRKFAFYMEQYSKEYPSQREASEMAAESIWNDTLSLYENMGFGVEMIVTPPLFSETVSQMSAMGDKNRARFGAAANNAKELLKPYCTYLKRMKED